MSVNVNRKCERFIYALVRGGYRVSVDTKDMAAHTGSMWYLEPTVTITEIYTEFCTVSNAIVRIYSRTSPFKIISVIQYHARKDKSFCYIATEEPEISKMYAEFDFFDNIDWYDYDHKP